MKKLFLMFAAAAMILAGGCSSEYDDTAINNRVDNLEGRVAKLEELCKQMNTNISSLQTLVTALQNNDYVTSVTPVTKNGETVGYTIAFSKSAPITIYHGQNGKDGANGADGKDGADGKNGHTPVIGVRQDADGVYYWTLDGDWLRDNSGNKIKAEGKDGQNGTDGKDGQDGQDGSDGKDGQDGQPGADGKDGANGITPQLKIENGYWYVSTDNGATWTNLGKATGESGSSFFQSVTQDEDYVYLTLSTGEKISVPKHHPLSIAFDETEDIRVLADKTYSIGYTITGADDKTVVKALAQDGFRAVVKKTDNATGTIEVTTPSTILPTEILVFVTDGKERTIIRSINFVEGVIIISSNTYTVGYEGGTVEVPLSTNIDYTVGIPEADQAWISVASIDTRAVMRDETVVFNVAANNTLTARYTVVKLVDALGITGQTILISQKAGSAQELHIATAGSLETIITADKKDTIEELTLTGTLNTFDFDFIRTMKNLHLLDLSRLTDTTIPTGCLANSTIETVILPLKLTAIPNRAFYQSAITSIYIPETVESIGDCAFYQCKAVTGNLVIPDATTYIGEYCFTESTFDGTLTIGNGVQTIGQYAFSGCANFTGDLLIPDSVTTLGAYAFNQCGGFSGKVVVGNNVTAVPERAFFECSGLTGTVTLGEKIESIGDCAFAGCEKLTGNLIIPDKVAAIGYNAFYNCPEITGYLSIGRSVTKIGYGAFSSGKTSSNNNYHYKASVFSRVYCKAVQPPVLDHSTSGSSEDTNSTKLRGYAFGYYESNSMPTCTLYVPAGCKNAYDKATGWGTVDGYYCGKFPTIEEIEF